MAADEDGRPRSVKEISAEAQDYKFDATVPLKYWLRTARTLNHEAGVYLREGNFPKAYLLYLRQSDLVMNQLSRHPEAKTPDGKLIMKQALGDISNVIVHLENMKPIISRDHQEYLIKLKERKELQKKQALEKNQSTSQTPYERHAARDPALSSGGKLLDAGEHLDLAVHLAKREFQRRDDDKRASRQAGMSADEERHRRTAGFWNNWTDELAKRQAEDEEFFRRRMETSRRNTDGDDDSHIQEFVQKMSRADREREGISEASAGTDTNTNYHYPSISRSTPVDYAARVDNAVFKAPQPPRPPKESVPSPYQEYRPPLPDLPSKELLWPLPTLEPSQTAPKRPPKDLDQPPARPSKKPNRETLTFKPAAYLENGEPIRCVIFPSQMREDFLKLAAENTRRGVEMCGVLCGTSVNNALFVRCLVIPEQICTSDTCETENEGALFEYCDKEDLLQLGWIHTHPTQTCFMSSRDLHTHAGYQIMLPESIAVVCAPRYEPSYGIFRLTNPPGLSHILQCTQSNTFHPHSVDNLYTGASKSAGGHVYETDNLDYEVHDLRPGAKNTKR